MFVEIGLSLWIFGPSAIEHTAISTLGFRVGNVACGLASVVGQVVFGVLGTMSNEVATARR